MKHSIEQNKSLLLSKKGKVFGPMWMKKIINKNRRVLDKKEKNNFNNELNSYTKSIKTKLIKLRGSLKINPKFSVIVPAHNEEDYILQLLESISNQKNIGKVEVIIVVNNSNDKTAKFSKKCGVKVIDYQLDKKYPPVAYARQKGLVESKGEIILSTDADALVGENWMEELTKPIIEDENVTVSIGEINFYDGKSLPLINPIMKLIRKYEIKFFPKNGIVGFANIAFRKKDIMKVGGWPQLSAEEDTRLVRKLISIGKPRFTNNKTTIWVSGRRWMLPVTKIIEEKFKRGGDHFIDKDGNLKIVR